MVTKSVVKQNLAFLLLKILPRNLLSRLVGALVSLRLPQPFRKIIIQNFANYYKINVAEAEKTIDEYSSIQDFFTRRLKKGIRPISGSLVHPADAVITSHGRIHSSELIQAKGLSYSVAELLGENTLRFEGGYYITYYLCPTDYHRVHCPCEYRIEKIRFLSGDLWPVNAISVLKVPKLFAINERVVSIGNGGSLSLVMVGATNVGKIRLSFSGEISRGFDNTIEFHPPKKLSVGEEFGVFNMGSTVILLLDPSYQVAEVKSGAVKLGEKLGAQINQEILL